jgi:hypothetical protein
MPWKLQGTLEERTRKAVELGHKAKLRGMDRDRDVAEWLQSVKDGEGRPDWGPILEDVKAHCRKMGQKPPVTRLGQVVVLATMLHALMKGWRSNAKGAYGLGGPCGTRRSQCR